MSIEVEIKLKINEKKSIEEKLAESGFQKGALVRESDTYYMAAHHDFVALDEALRVRTVRKIGQQVRSLLPSLIRARNWIRFP